MRHVNTLLLMFLLLLGLTAPGCDGNDVTGREDNTENLTPEQQGYIKEVEAKIEDAEGGVKKLQTSAESAEGELKTSLENARKQVSEQLDNARSRLSRLKSATTETFDDRKKEMKAAMESLDDQLDDAEPLLEEQSNKLPEVD